jgi:hypothetical protein
MAKRNDGGYGFAVFARDANDKIGLEILREVAKPASWLGQELVAAPCNQKQIAKLIEELRG